jgi:multiple sugar transport system permease protein
MHRRKHSAFWPTAGWSGLYVVLCLAAFVMTLPFVWMLFGSFKSRAEVEEVYFVPRVWEPANYAIVLGLAPDRRTGEPLSNVQFTRWFYNSIFVSLAVTFFHLLTSAMAAYAFSHVRWWGRDRLFFLYLATMMIPGVVLMIPNFQIMVWLHLIDSYAGLIIPPAFGAFGTFLMRQFMLTIPTALTEAASIDGAKHSQIFWDVILPLSRPGLVTLAIFTLLASYQSFFWPLVLLKTDALFTLPIGLLNFDSSHGRQTELILAATVLSTLPLIILFMLAQKAIVKGIQLGAVKG